MDPRITSLLYTSDAIASVALILFLMLVRLVTGRAIARRENLTEQVVRRWTANIRNLLILIAVIGLIMIWAPQLRTFALSVTALAVAIVVATKELLLCLSGAALQTFTRAFSVGDFVEIGSSKGEVLDLSLLAARLREFEDRDGSVVSTGRIVTLPYSLLFSAPAKVLAHTGSPAPHRFVLIFEPDVDVFALRAEIENLALEAAGNLDRGALGKGQARLSAPALSVQFGTTEIGKYRIEITLSRPAAHPAEIENAITCAVGSFLHRRREDEDVPGAVRASARAAR